MVTVLDDEADPVFDVLNSTAKALFLRSELTLQNVNLSPGGECSLAPA